MILKTIKADSLNVKVYDNRNCMGKRGAIEFADCLRALLAEKQTVNIVFAAAPSQLDFLANLKNQSEIDWERVNVFHMDEYVGVSIDNTQSFARFIKEHVVDVLRVGGFYPIKGNVEDVEKECLRYSELLQRFKPDIVCCGIGENAHIAFNDPGGADFWDEKTVKVVKLDEVCRMQQVNDKCFETIEQVPEYAITLTIPTLLRAKNIFCLVPGKTKANAVKNAILGSINVMCPATALRLHGNAKFYCDADSGKYLLYGTKSKIC